MVNPNENSINPLLGMFPDDTLGNCSKVLRFLEMTTIEDCPSEAEIYGLTLIHLVVRKALDYEILRVGQLRKSSND